MSQLLARTNKGNLPAIQLDAPPPETPGSVAWVAQAVFGGQREFEDMLQSIVVGQGAAGDYKWRQLVSVILKLREAGTEYNLNQLCQSLSVPTADLLEFVGSAVQQIQSSIATNLARMSAPEVVKYALAASRDVEYGFKDRQMLLEIAQVKQGSGGGVNVNVNQQVAMKVGKEDLIAPLRQFRGVAEEIDSKVREAVDGEIVD